MDAKLGMISPAGSALTENHEGLMINFMRKIGSGGGILGFAIGAHDDSTSANTIT